MKKIKGLIKKLVIVCILIYTAVTFINQQKILNTYATNKVEVESKLAEAKKYGEELKENLQSHHTCALQLCNRQVFKRERSRRCIQQGG